MPSPTMATFRFFCLQPADEGSLVLRQYTGMVVGDACFTGNLTGGGLIVSGQHADFDAGGAQLADSARMEVSLSGL